MRVKTKIDEIKGDPRYQFMFSGMLVGDTMADFIGQDLPHARRTASRSRSSTSRACRRTSPRPWSRCSAGWCSTSRSGAARRRPGRSCSSARKRTATCPTRRTPTARRSAASSAASPRKAASTASALGLITQRPSDLAEGVLSQCGTIISMRLNNDRDQAFVKAAMPEGARGFLDSIPALRNRECIICGEGVAIPIRVVVRQPRGSRSARPRKTPASPTCGARAAARKSAWSSAPSSAGARRAK